MTDYRMMAREWLRDASVGADVDPVFRSNVELSLAALLARVALEARPKMVLDDVLKTAYAAGWRDAIAAVGKAVADMPTQDRPMTGFFAGLTEEQKRRALAYQGDDHHGDHAAPPPPERECARLQTQRGPSHDG